MNTSRDLPAPHSIMHQLPGHTLYVSPQVPSTTVLPSEHGRLLTRAFGHYHAVDEDHAVATALGAAFHDAFPDKPLSIADAQMLSQLARKLVQRGVLIILP